MSVAIETLVGVGASCFTATALIPQLIKLLKEKKSGSVSVVMLCVLFTGLGLWVYYGVLKSDWIIIISNGFALVIIVWIGVLTIRYKNGSP
jgi:MtN3 and saliva related transmembrane protein